MQLPHTSRPTFHSQVVLNTFLLTPDLFYGFLSIQGLYKRLTPKTRTSITLTSLANFFLIRAETSCALVNKPELSSFSYQAHFLCTHLIYHKDAARLVKFLIQRLTQWGSNKFDNRWHILYAYLIAILSGKMIYFSIHFLGCQLW